MSFVTAKTIRNPTIKAPRVYAKFSTLAGRGSPLIASIASIVSCPPSSTGIGNRFNTPKPVSYTHLTLPTTPYV